MGWLPRCSVRSVSKPGLRRRRMGHRAHSSSRRRLARSLARRSRRLLLAALAAPSVLIAADGSQHRYVLGTPLPDDLVGFASAPALNETGDAAYMKRLVGLVDILALGRAGRLSRIGSDACGGANSTPSLNERGDIVFTVHCDGPVVHVVEFAPAGSSSSHALAGYTFNGSLPSKPALNDRGEVAAILGTIFGSVPPQFVVFHDGRSVTVAARGDSAPNTGRRFTSFSGDLLGGPTLNDAGEVAFRGVYDDRDGIFESTPGGLRSIALEGGQLPGTAGRFGDFANPRINNAGDVAFRATFGGAEGIFTTSGGRLHLAAVSGRPVPGVTGRFDHFGDPVLNGQGNVAFVGDFGGSSGIFATQAGRIVPIALAGQPAPSVGQTFVEFRDAPAFNRAGQVAFLAGLSGGGVGLFVGDSESGDLALIVSPGQSIEVAPGDVRKVSALSFEGSGTGIFLTSFAGGSGDEDGLPSGLNERDQIGFSVLLGNDTPQLYDDLSGVFIATPEPISPS